MIGLWLEKQNDQVLQNVSDAPHWCAFAFLESGKDETLYKCLMVNAGISSGTSVTTVDTKIMVRYDQAAVRLLHDKNTILKYDPHYRQFVRIRYPHIRIGPHVEYLRIMIQNRARKILAQRQLKEAENGNIVGARS